MYPFQANIITLIFSLGIFHLYGIVFGILLFPKIISKKCKEKKLLELYFILIAISITINSFIGYLLDIFYEINVYIHISILIISFLITLVLRRNFLQKIIRLLKSRENLIKFSNINQRNNKFSRSFISLFIIVLFFNFINIFSYNVENYSIMLTDPFMNMIFIRETIEFGHISFYHGIGLMNMSTRNYPYGFLINLSFIASYDIKNLFIITKFVGPILTQFSCIQMYMITKKITKNKIAAIMAMLVWESSYIINYFFVATIASSMGMFMALTATNLFFDKISNDEYNISRMVSGFIFAGGLFVHSFTGGIFVLSAVGIVLLYEIIMENGRKKKIVEFLTPLLIFLSPYILTFNFPIFIYLFGDESIFNPSSSSLFLILQNPKLFEIDFNYIEYGWSLILLWGPSLIFIFLSILGFIGFKPYKKFFLFSSSLSIIALIFILNPFVINGIYLTNRMNIIYESYRGNFSLSLGIAFLIGIAFSSIYNKFKTAYHLKEYLIVFIFQYKRNKSKKISLVTIILTIFFFNCFYNQGIYSITKPDGYYGQYWPQAVPSDYTEVLNWMELNLNENDLILVDNDSFSYPNSKIIDLYHESLIGDLNYIRNSSFFEIAYSNEFTSAGNWSIYENNSDITEVTPSSNWYNLSYQIPDNKDIIEEHDGHTSVLQLYQENSVGLIYYDTRCKSFNVWIWIEEIDDGNDNNVYLGFKNMDYSGFHGIKIINNSIFVTNDGIYENTTHFINYSTWTHLNLTLSENLTIYMDDNCIFNKKTTPFNVYHIYLGSGLGANVYFDNIFIADEKSDLILYTYSKLYQAGFFLYNYVIIPEQFIPSYKEIINEKFIQLLYSSLNDEYHVFFINN